MFMLKLRSSVPSRLCKSSRRISTTTPAYKTHCCKVLFVGGGTAGISTAMRFSKTLNKHELIIVEPEDIHYYQSSFTWIGAGLKTLRQSVEANLKILPKNAIWLRDSVAHFCPNNNAVILKSGHFVEYEVMVLALGLNLDFDKIVGLTDALENYRNVSTIYSYKYVEKTFKSLKEFVTGTAIFTSPNTPIKCLSAPLKICFLAEDYFKRRDKMSETDLSFATAEENLYPVGIYDDLLRKIAKRKRIETHVRTNLIQVIPDKKQAVFECLNNPPNKITWDYNLLHVTPPMSPPRVLKDCKDLVDKSGYADVDLYTLKHKKFPNVYAVGDCGPGAKNKTSSALSGQSYVVFKNVSARLEGKEPREKYYGYTVCPIVTGVGKCVLAEYDYSLTPKSTFPIRQNYESRMMYFVKKYILPQVYWRLLLKGRWKGTETLRRILHFEFFRIRRNK